MESIVARPGQLAVVLLLSLSVTQIETTQAAQGAGELLAADQIAAAIGGEADARTVMSMFLRDAFRPGARPRAEYVLRSQMRDDWRSHIEGVEIVQLSTADAAARWATCGSYFVISALRQSNGSVRVIRQHSALHQLTEPLLRSGTANGVQSPAASALDGLGFQPSVCAASRLEPCAGRRASVLTNQTGAS
jgi:hypothetical protein